MTKFREFLKKLNNSYILVGICLALAFIITLGLMIGLVAHPFVTNYTYSANIREEALGQSVNQSVKLVLLDDGRYKVTIYDRNTRETTTSFGDYSYGKVILEEGKGRQNVIWFDSNIFTPVVQQNPFKIVYGDVTYTNVGGILLLVFYCMLLVVFGACSVLLFVTYKKGNPVFGTRMTVFKRLAQIEQMLGIHHDA